MNETDLKMLFQRFREGDENAFAAIYQTLKLPVYTVCWRIVQIRETAEDLTHEIFLKLYISPPEETVRNERAWVFQMAHNASIDVLRKRRELPWDGKECAAEEKFTALDQSLDLESAMSRLPDDYRQIITLHLNAGLSFQQISQIMGLSLSGAFRNYRKAIKLLRQLLEGGTV